MERATIELAPPVLPVVKERADGSRRHGRSRELRMVTIGVALAAGVACAVVLSRSALQGEEESARADALVGTQVHDGFAGIFGQTKLASMPLHHEPSTDDLISIMRGKGRQDVSADQGLLFAGGAGGKIKHTDPAEGLWRAAERASRLEHRAKKSAARHDTFDDDLDDIERSDAQDEQAQPAKSPEAHEHLASPQHSAVPIHAASPSAPPKKVAAGWTAEDEQHKMTVHKHQALLSKGSKRAAASVRAASNGEGASKATSAQHDQKVAKRSAGSHEPIKPWVSVPASVAAKVSDAQDGYFKRHMSVDDALDQVAKIRAQHDAAQSAEAVKARLAKEAQMSRERAKELATEHEAQKMAREEATHAKAMEAKAVKAAKEAEADELKAARESAQMKEQLALKRKEAKELEQEKHKLAMAKLHAQEDKVDKTREAADQSPKPVSAGWTQADAKRAAQLAKKFAAEEKMNLENDRKPVKALDIYQSGFTGSKLSGPPAGPSEVQPGKTSHWKARAFISDSTAQAREHAKDEAAAREVAPLYPTGFIPSKKQHDDAHQPDAMPEMISSIHAAREDHAHPLSLDREAQNLKRESKMKSKEAAEEKLRRQEEREQEELYKEGHSAADRERAERAGERLVSELSSHARVARIMGQVDMTGIPFSESLKEAIAGDAHHFGVFKRDTWMDECGGSQLMLAPVAKQVLAIMDDISTKNASAWLDVEDAQRRADAAKADLRSAEAGLVSVLESEDRTKAVEQLEKLREHHEQRRAERKADSIARANEKEGQDKAALLLQQREALGVLSHAEEAQALSGDERRVELNKAAFGAQDAVNKEEKLADGGDKAPGYVAGFESKLLATATRPWSLDAQEGVQTLLGNINSRILAIEHTEQGRSAGLTSLEAKVAERMHKVSEVDAAEAKLKAELARQHQTLQELRSDAAGADDALTRSMRTYQVLLSEDAAEAQAAQQAVDRLKSLMEACQPAGVRDTLSQRPAESGVAGRVKPWVTSPSSSLMAHTVESPKQSKVQPVAADSGAVQRQQQERREKQKVAGQEKTVRDLDKQLEQLKPLAHQQRAADRTKEPHHKTQLSLSPMQHAGRTIRIGDKVYIRETPSAPRSHSGTPKGEDELLSKEMAAANRDESSMENSEEQKLSSVASMIVSEPRE